MKKRMIVSVLSLALICMLGGCGTQGNTQSGEPKPVENTIETTEAETEKTQDMQTQEEQKEQKDIEETQQSDANQEEQAEELPEEVVKEPFVEDRSEVFALFAQMTSGWNLGNTLDAIGAGNSNSAETYWGNPKTTQEMIDGILDKGFNVIRIPITWGEHVGPAPDYAINPAWLDRVEEVVRYVTDRGAFAIIDTHHEESFWLQTGTDEANVEAVEQELCAIWTQVSERFKDYDEKLIFEGMNEPRKVGSENEWNGGSAEERAVINRWNQAFIDAVRATGGNNETRVLIICPYGNSANLKALKELAIPEDNHIAVAVHMYTPYYFTYAQTDPKNDIVNWDGSRKADIVNTIQLLKDNYIKKDVPVIITEYGAVNKNNRPEIDKWVEDYVGAMTKAGIRCIWWDNGIYNQAGEKFGIFNRRTLSWDAESTADKIIEVSTREE